MNHDLWSGPRPAGPVLFGVPDYVPALMEYVRDYHIGLNFSHTLVAVDGPVGAAVSGPGGRSGIDWSAVVLAVWAAGAAAALARYGLAMISVRLVARGARPVTRGEWMDRLHAASRELGMRERVRLLRADGAAMPMTWGILHPAVLVPADADGVLRRLGARRRAGRVVGTTRPAMGQGQRRRRPREIDGRVARQHPAGPASWTPTTSAPRLERRRRVVAAALPTRVALRVRACPPSRVMTEPFEA